VTGRPERAHISEVAERHREPIERFIEVAERYCALIESWQQDASQFADVRDFLRRVERLLPEIYLRALDLPETHALFAAGDEPEAGATAAVEPPKEATTTGSSSDRLQAQKHAEGERFPGLEGYGAAEVHLIEPVATSPGTLDHYASVFHPYAAAFREGEPKVVGNLLSDDLGSVYDWLRKPLIVWEHGGDDATFEALWDWRLDLDSHAGDHLVSALRALYWLLHRHPPDDDE
jgi:hypothetical protein